MSFKSGFHDSNQLQYQHRSDFHPSGTSSTVTAYVVLVSIILYYTVQYLDPVGSMGLPLSEILWNAFVWITPSQLIARFDRVFEKAMIEEKTGTEISFDPKGHASKGNAMRRILGLDGTGILSTVRRTRTFSNLGSVFKARPNASLPGLGNWDNSCYQNSVLQGLAALKSLPAFLDQKAQLDGLSSTKSALRKLIRRLNDPANVGKTLWTPAELKSMSSWQQQDAQEYFSKISAELEKDLSKDVKQKIKQGGLEELSLGKNDGIAPNFSETDSIPTVQSSSVSTMVPRIGRMPEELLSLIGRNPLEGLLAQRVGCQKCGFVEGLSLVPFNCLTVSLGKGWMYDIHSCLDDYTTLEPINGVECGKCTLLCAKRSLEQVLRAMGDSGKGEGDAPYLGDSNPPRTFLQARLKLVNQALDDEDFSDQVLKMCQIPQKGRVSTTKSRQAVIARAPKCLVIHVNRSNFDELTGVQSKNMAHVRFSKRLHLAPWCLGHTPGQDLEGSSVESWNTDPSESMLSDKEFGGTGSDRNYELRAVITHYGRHENGHYICYRKSPCSTKTDEKAGEESWWRLSDEDVIEVDEETVLSQGGVFMLFYEQVAPFVHAPRPNISPQHTKAEHVDEASKRVQVETTSIANDCLSPTTDPKPQSSVLEESALPTPPPTPIHHCPGSELSSPANDPEITPKSESTDSRKSSPSGASASSTSTAPLNPPRPSTHPASSLSKTNDDSSGSLQQQPSSKSKKEVHPVSPTSMRTAAPRSGGSRGMGSMAGFVQAN